MHESIPKDGFALGGPIGRVSVTLRVIGDEVDPDEITRLLGVTPTMGERKGDVVRRGDRMVTRRTGHWSYSLGGGPSPEWELDDAIVAVLGRMSADLEVWADLARRFRLDVFCGLFMGTVNQGAVLRPGTMRLLAERGLTLGLDVYGPQGIRLPPSNEEA